ncbi:MAG: Thymidylate kinase [Candidatus Levybacteria bacterium]|nr:Thymidylate kinase [Candidatus Levybacteria bacterium]
MKYHVKLDIELKKNPYSGTYIALEGVDGSGKTTQVEKLAEYYKKLGKTVVQTREPRKTGVIGDIVQQVLTGKLKMSSVALQYLFSTDRMLHHEDVIIPALKRGDVIISDRCFWSAIVYGILDRTKGKYDYKDAEFLLIVHSLLSMYHQFIVPDYTFYLKVSLATVLKRISNKADDLEIYEDSQKLKKAIEGYDWLSGKFAQEIITIDGEGSVEEVTKRLISQIKI